MVKIRHSLHPKYLDVVISHHEYIVESQSEICKHPGYEDYECRKNDLSIYKMKVTKDLLP